MSGGVLNSRFLTRLLTSGKGEFERLSVLNRDNTSTACELTMLMLSISVTFSVICLTVASLSTKPCQQRWPVHPSIHPSVLISDRSPQLKYKIHRTV